MANGKLRDYYWQIKTFLAEYSDYLDAESSAFHFPDEDFVVFRALIDATIVFRDGAQLRVRSTLDDAGDVREYDYAYVYFDRHHNRSVQYEDSPHHPEISTFPHHMHRGVKPRRGPEQVFASDLPASSTIAVLQHIIKNYSPRRHLTLPAKPSGLIPTGGPNVTVAA